jgi:SAM-dependent methyltransferase
VAQQAVPAVIVTGERVVTSEGGFNPTFRRTEAAYVAAARILGPGRMLDLGAGTGHSYHHLAPRETVGVDLAAEALAAQDRETVVADMRRLPFPDASFASVLSVQSIEHVPDPQRVLAGVARVLEPGGTAIFVTPNRLTFLRPDEIIDPYHYVEYDPEQLRALCSRHFGSVEMKGVYGSPRYLELVAREKRLMDRRLALDPLRLRRLLPRRAKQLLYDLSLTRARKRPDPAAAAIEVGDFELRDGPLPEALDLFAVCRGPIAGS